MVALGVKKLRYGLGSTSLVIIVRIVSFWLQLFDCSTASYFLHTHRCINLESVANGSTWSHHMWMEEMALHAYHPFGEI